MTQCELFPNSKFTLDTLCDTCDAFWREHGFPLKRLVLTRKNYDELLAALPLGTTLYATEHGLPIFNGVVIEVLDPPKPTNFDPLTEEQTATWGGPIADALPKPKLTVDGLLRRIYSLEEEEGKWPGIVRITRDQYRELCDDPKIYRYITDSFDQRREFCGVQLQVHD